MDLSTNSGDNHACRIRDARGDYTDGEWRGVHYLGDSGGTHATSHTLSQMRKDVQLAADLNNLEGHMYDIDMNPPDYEAEPQCAYGGGQAYTTWLCNITIGA